MGVSLVVRFLTVFASRKISVLILRSVQSSRDRRSGVSRGKDHALSEKVVARPRKDFLP